MIVASLKTLTSIVGWIVIVVGTGFIFFHDEVHGKITTKSVWHQTNYNTISSRDLMGNSVSIVCTHGIVDMYLSTAMPLSRDYQRTVATLWAERENRYAFRAHTRSQKSIRIRLSDYQVFPALLNDMKNKYDLSIYLQGPAGTDIILFALDGFSKKYNRVCK